MESAMTKILWISMCPPIPTVKNAGGQTFNYYYNAFRDNGEFELTLISKLTNSEWIGAESYRDETNRVYIKNRTGIRRIVDLMYSVFSKVNPYSKYGNSLLKSTYRDIEREIKRLKMGGYNPDCVVLEWGQMGLFVDSVKKYFPYAKYVVSDHDVMFLGLQRKVAYADSVIGKILANARFQNIKKRELKMILKCDLIVTHNEKDKHILLDEGVEYEKIHVIVPFYNRIIVERKSNKRDILFFGAMNRAENYLSAIWFIEQVMPKLERFDIRFVVVGGNPDESLFKYASERVVITGFVDDLAMYFGQCLCLVASLVLGAGIKVKVLEAAAAGVPILTNEIGIEGIPLIKNEEYIHCETADDYVTAIGSIVTGEKNVDVIAKRAKSHLFKEFNLENSVQDYIDKIRQLSQNNNRDPA